MNIIVKKAEADRKDAELAKLKNNVAEMPTDLSGYSDTLDELRACIEKLHRCEMNDLERQIKETTRAIDIYRSLGIVEEDIHAPKSNDRTDPPRK